MFLIPLSFLPPCSHHLFPSSHFRRYLYEFCFYVVDLNGIKDLFQLTCNSAEGMNQVVLEAWSVIKMDKFGNQNMRARAELIRQSGNPQLNDKSEKTYRPVQYNCSGPYFHYSASTFDGRGTRFLVHPIKSSFCAKESE